MIKLNVFNFILQKKQVNYKITKKTKIFLKKKKKKKRDQEELLISEGIKELYTGYVLLLWNMEEMFQLKYNKNKASSSHTPE